MEWIKISEQEPDLNRIHLLVDGDSIYMRGTQLQPFFVALCGEIKTFSEMNWTHWAPLPLPPKKEIPNENLLKE